MSQRSIRFSDDLEAKIQRKADKLDRSFSWVVLRACEVALEGEQGALGRAVVRGATRAPVIPEDVDAFQQGETPSRADRFRNARKP